MLGSQGFSAYISSPCNPLIRTGRLGSMKITHASVEGSFPRISASHDTSTEMGGEDANGLLLMRRQVCNT
jgi:hypothetical protein